MRGTKKLLAFTICIALVLGLAACGGTVPAPNATPAPSNTPGGDGAAKEWPAITIEYWNQNSASQGEEVTNALIKRFNETNGKNITVVNKFIPNQYQGIATELQSALMTGQYPGIVQCGYSYLNYFADNFQKHIITPETIIEKYAPQDANYFAAKFSDRTLALATAANGTLMGFPYACSQSLLYYNADLFRAAGLDPDAPPKTYDEMIDHAYKIKNVTGKRGFYLQAIADIWPNIPMILSTGTELYEMKDGKAVATFNTPRVVDAWTKLQQPYKDNITVNVNLEEGGAAFCAGEFGMCITTSARIKAFSEASKFDLRATSHPITATGDKRAVAVGGNLLLIVAGDNPDKVLASWEFLKFMYENSSVTDWVKATGYLPPTEGVADSEDGLKSYYQENAMAAAALESWQNAAAQWPSWPGPNGLSVEQILVDMRDQIITGFQDPKVVIAEAQDKVNKLLA